MSERMVNNDPKLLLYKTKKWPNFFTEVRDCLFDP